MAPALVAKTTAREGLGLLAGQSLLVALTRFMKSLLEVERTC